LNDNLLSLKYNSSRKNYNSHEDENIILWYRFDDEYSIGKDCSEKLNQIAIMNNVATIAVQKNEYVWSCHGNRVCR
jgi:hypothetical protein